MVRSVGSEPIAGDRRRGARTPATIHHRRGDEPGVLDSHQQNEGPAHPRQPVPVDQAARVVGWKVPRDDGELVHDASVGDRDACERRHGDG